MTVRKFFAIGFIAIAALIGPIIIVFLSGQTFGQRCAAAYASPSSIEECVHRLSAGGMVYVQ